MSEPSETKEAIKVFNFYRDTERSIARISIHGINQRVINHLSKMTYEVMCGAGLMNIDGVDHELRVGVEHTIPAGTAYQNMSTGEGNLILRAIAEPPFDATTVEVIEPIYT